MEKKVEKQIIFGLLILVIIFFAFSQLFPWSTVTSNNVEIGSFYSWGFKQSIAVGQNQSQGLYITGALDIFHFIGEIPVEQEELINFFKIYGIGFLILFISWILTILILVFSIFTFYYLYSLQDYKMERWIFNTTVFSVFNFFMFYIGINFFIMDPIKSQVPYTDYTISGFFNVQLHWSLGFFLFLFGLIIITSLMIYFSAKKFSKGIKTVEKKRENNKD
jgi:hypothetical protein